MQQSGAAARKRSDLWRQQAEGTLGRSGGCRLHVKTSSRFHHHLASHTVTVALDLTVTVPHWHSGSLTFTTLPISALRLLISSSLVRSSTWRPLLSASSWALVWICTRRNKGRRALPHQHPAASCVVHVGAERWGQLRMQRCAEGRRGVQRDAEGCRGTQRDAEGCLACSSSSFCSFLTLLSMRLRSFCSFSLEDSASRICQAM